MAKADDTTTTILLNAAKALVVEAYDGSHQLAKQLLVEGLREGRVRWSCKHLRGGPTPELLKTVEMVVTPSRAYSKGDPAFWAVGNLEINWEENSAREPPYVDGGTQVYGVTVLRGDVLSLLPPSERGEADSSKAWIAAEVRRMKDAGEIRADIKKTDLAKEIEARMGRAGIRQIGYRSIVNGLSGWGLWPIISIK